MNLCQDLSFLATDVAHFFVDLLHSLRPLLLSAHSVPLGLSNVEIGLTTTFDSLSGVVTQPLFGLLTDRIGYRWDASMGVLWMVFCFSFALTVLDTRA